MANTPPIDQQLQDLRDRRSQPDLQMDVLDSELPTLEGEVETTRNQEEAEYIDALQGLRELQVGDPVRWKVFRIDNPTGDRKLNGYCYPELGTTELTLENIAKRWGGGKYRIRGTFSNGKFAGGKTIDIAGDCKPLEIPAVIQPTISQGSQFDMQSFLVMQERADQRRREEDKAREARSQELWMKTLAIVTPALSSVVAALISRPSGGQSDLPALITALRPTVAPPDPMDSLKKMAETMALLNKMNGANGDGDSLASILTAVGPYAAPVLGALANRPATPLGRVPPQPNPSQIPVRVVPNVAPQPQPVPIPVAQTTVLPAHTGVNLDAPSQALSEGDRNMFAQLKPQVDALVTMAAQGSDAVQTADVFFEHVMLAMDEALYNRIAAFVLSPNAISQLSVFNTGVKTHEAFFTSFRDRLMARIQGEDQAAMQPNVVSS